MIPRVDPETGRNLVTNLHRWQSLRSELLFIYDALVPAEAEETFGSREGEFSAWLIRKGSVELSADGERASARAGEWIVCFGRQVRQKFVRGSQLLSLRVLQNWPDGSGIFSGGPLAVFKASDYPQVERTAMRLLRSVGTPSLAGVAVDDPRFMFLWQTQFDYDRYLTYERNLLTWLGTLSAALQSKGLAVHQSVEVDVRLAKACQVIDSVPVGDPFPERALIRTTGLTLGRLNQLFNQTYGWSAHAHWEKRRVDRARHALERPDVRVKEVASQLGFLQLSHFSAWFKRNAGASPRAYRRQVSAGSSLGR
jgi:AraC-like DNA-binding protein